MPSEAVVAQVDDLEDGDMRQVSVGETDVLLARIAGSYYATYAYCTHYGGPLADGALSEGRVVCPWHHACFELSTGRQLEPPGRDGLPHFDVRVEGTDVIVHVPDDFEEHVVPSMARRAGRADRPLVVLGSGAAGAHAVEAARAAGFDGRLLLIAAEEFPPVDRPNLSKDYLQGEAPMEWMPLRPAAFYAEHDIEVVRGRTVTAVDASARTLTFADGEVLRYDTLIVATGGTPRALGVAGEDLEGIYTLRHLPDSDRIREAAENAERAVIVGASFIGMEGAASLRALDDAPDVTVVAPEAVPFEKTFGARVGRMLQQRHEEHGVRFVLNQEVRAFEGDGAVERVVLQDGTSLPADLVVVGIGVRPATDFLHGIECAEDGGVIVDEHLRARLADDAAADGSLYAAGDIARFPDWRTGKPTRIEHWRLACQHGRIAGRNAAGRDESYRSIPYFWTAQHGMNLRYVGHAEDWDDIIFDGDPEGDAFIAYYIRGDQVLAALGLKRDRDMAALEALMQRDLLPSPDALRDGSTDLAERLKAAA